MGSCAYYSETLPPFRSSWAHRAKLFKPIFPIETLNTIFNRLYSSRENMAKWTNILFVIAISKWRMFFTWDGISMIYFFSSTFLLHFIVINLKRSWWFCDSSWVENLASTSPINSFRVMSSHCRSSWYGFDTTRLIVIKLWLFDLSHSLVGFFFFSRSFIYQCIIYSTICQGRHPIFLPCH